MLKCVYIHHFAFVKIIMLIMLFYGKAGTRAKVWSMQIYTYENYSIRPLFIGLTVRPALGLVVRPI